MLAPPDWWLSQIGSVFPVLGSYPVMHASGTIQKLRSLQPKIEDQQARLVIVDEDRFNANCGEWWLFRESKKKKKSKG